eukprot:GFUD01011718.1.p2 GENE.GFUD01011718.1~~GFUD01011718.1.p2  ORF type:complete len:116 (+),score=47.01 GFUD01011718.1:102-449(+)
MVSKDCEGGWEFQTEKSPIPVKLIVKKMSPTDWIVACMVPRGNMMHCLLKEESSNNLNQVKFNTTGKEPPVDIMEVETEMMIFLEAGITDITREGNILRVKAGEKEMDFTWDKSQ